MMDENISVQGFYDVLIVLECPSQKGLKLATVFRDGNRTMNMSDMISIAVDRASSDRKGFSIWKGSLMDLVKKGWTFLMTARAGTVDVYVPRCSDPFGISCTKVATSNVDGKFMCEGCRIFSEEEKEIGV